MPQFTELLREWNTDVAVTDADVTFTAPEGARTYAFINFDALGTAKTE